MYREEIVFLVGQTGRFNIDFWGNYFLWCIFAVLAISLILVWDVENTNFLGGQIGRLEKCGCNRFKNIEGVKYHRAFIADYESVFTSPKKNDGNTRAAYMKRLLRLTKMRDWHPSVGSERRVPRDGLLGIARHCYVFHHSEHHSLQCPSGLASFDPLGKLRGSQQFPRFVDVHRNGSFCGKKCMWGNFISNDTDICQTFQKTVGTNRFKK